MDKENKRKWYKYIYIYIYEKTILHQRLVKSVKENFSLILKL